MFFCLNGSGRINGIILAISISFLALFSACQPDIEEVITKNDVAYLDSLLAEKRGRIIHPAGTKLQDDTFLPWKKEYEQTELFFHRDSVLYEADVAVTITGLGFRQDNIVIDQGYGIISNIEVLNTDGGESLVLKIDSADRRNSINVRLNRFVQRNEEVRLQYTYHLPLSAELLKSTKLLPFSRKNSDTFFWVERPEWLPLLPTIVNAKSDENASQVSKEWHIHVRNGFKAVSTGQLLKETHSDSASSYYFIDRAEDEFYEKSYLAIVPDHTSLFNAENKGAVLHGISKNTPQTKLLLQQLNQYARSNELPGNWFFWDFPFHVSLENTVFVPTVALIDSTVYPDISNQKLFGTIASGKKLNLPPAEDYPSLLFSEWLTRLTYLETVSNEEKIVEITRSKQKLRNEMDYYMRSVFEPKNDSLSFYFDAHQTEKGFLALRYLKSQFDTSVWKAFITDVKQQSHLNEENLKKLLSEYSGMEMTDYWQNWFYQPGFPIIYTELFTFENEVNLRMRQIRSHSTLPIFDLKIPARIEYIDGERRDTLFNFSTQDTLFVFQDSINDLLIDPDFTVPAFFHHKRDTALISHRLQSDNPGELIPLVNSNTIPGNDSQRKRFQEILFDDESDKIRPILLSNFLNYGVVEEAVYEKALDWDGRSKTQLLQFARTDSSRAAQTFTRKMMNDEQLFVQMEVVITAVIRGMADPVTEISTLTGVASYRDIKNKTAVYLSAFLNSNQQKLVLLNIWNSNITTDKTRTLILNWIENEQDIELFEQELKHRFWESKHLDLKKRILKLIAQKGDKDFRLAMKKDLLKMETHFWISLYQEAENGSVVQNDQSRQ